MHLHHAAKPNIFHCITERVACSATLSLPLITFPFNVYGYTVCVCVNAALPKIKCMSCTRHAESRRNTFIYIMWLIYHHRRTCTLTTEIDGIDFRAHTEQQEEGEQCAHWPHLTCTQYPWQYGCGKGFFADQKYPQTRIIHRAIEQWDALNSSLHSDNGIFAFSRWTDFCDAQCMRTRAPVRFELVRACGRRPTEQWPEGYIPIYMRSAHAQCAVVWCTKPSSSVGCKQTHARPWIAMIVSNSGFVYTQCRNQKGHI